MRLNTCHPKVEANHDRVALTRGPFVLCAEGVDNGGVTERYFFDQLPKIAGASVKTRSIESGSFIQTTVPARALTAAAARNRSRWCSRRITPGTIAGPVR